MCILVGTQSAACGAWSNRPDALSSKALTRIAQRAATTIPARHRLAGDKQNRYGPQGFANGRSLRRFSGNRGVDVQIKSQPRRAGHEENAYRRDDTYGAAATPCHAAT
jgi:hypothetical protein